MNIYEGWSALGCLRPGGEALTARLLELSGLEAGARVLDIGCGKGEAVRYMRACGLDAVGCDVSEQLVEAGQSLDAAPLIVADAASLPFEPEAFDALLLECVRSVIGEAALCGALSALKRGGKLLVGDIYSKDEGMPDVFGCTRLAFEDHSAALKEFAVRAIWNGVELGSRFDGVDGYCLAVYRKE